MKSRLIGAIALSLALSQFAAAAAYAEPAQTAAFRTAAPTAFTAQDLRSYGLSAADAAQVQSLQNQGYQVVTMTPDEARQVTAGDWSPHTWLIVGLIVVIVVVAASAD